MRANLAIPLASTVDGSREFSDGLLISWQPSTTTNQVKVQIRLGGSLLFSQLFIGDDRHKVDLAGDTYTIGGMLTTQYEADGISGQVDGDLNWTVSGDAHIYKGLIGLW